MLGRLITLTGLDAVGCVNGAMKDATCNYPMSVCSLDQRVYFTDYHNHNVRLLDLKEGQVSLIAGKLAATTGVIAGFDVLTFD